jgi:hypothetical protein
MLESLRGLNIKDDDIVMIKNKDGSYKHLINVKAVSGRDGIVGIDV